MNMVRMVTSATSQFSQRLDPVSATLLAVVMLLMAVGASINPMIITMGPVTTGGKNERILSAPNSFTRRASTTYSAPATTMPPQAYCSPS